MKTLLKRKLLMSSKQLSFVLVVLLIMSSPIRHTSAMSSVTVSPQLSKTRDVVIDFSRYTGGPVRKWLEARGFKPEKDAKDPKLLGLSITNRVLRLEANGSMSGFLLNDSVNLDDLKKIRITWGVKRYPLGASYENKINNEALMLYVFFGIEKLSSGNILIPPSPYFIGLFLCQNDKVNFPYMGLYYHHSGRFVCVGKPRPSEMIVSDFDLERAFKSYFRKNVTPVISGIGFGIDTSKAGNGGKSAAFIKSIEFFSEVSEASL